jgi:hypothetical protein
VKPYDSEDWGREGRLNFTDDYDQEAFPIDYGYSPDLKNLIASLLHPDWKKRPSAESILAQTQDWDCYEDSYTLAE